MDRLIESASLTPFMEWARGHKNVRAVYGYGSYFDGRKKSSDIDLVVVMKNECHTCELGDMCLTVEEMEMEFQADIPNECPGGYWNLLEFARNRNGVELPLDIKITTSNQPLGNLEFVSTITKSGWSHMTYCGDGFFSGAKLLHTLKL